MIHYTCDCCQRPIDTEEEVRYVVRMEVYSAIEPDSDCDAERDHLEEIEEILERLDDADSDLDGELYQQVRYDLCGDCRAKLLKNPLGRLAMTDFDFSEN